MPDPRRAFNFPWRSRARIARDIDDELRFHLEMRTQELRDRGLTTDAARREALRAFGDLDDARRYCRDLDARAARIARRTNHLEDFRQDLAYAWRTLVKSPLFALVAIVTIALGIGANTAMFSVVHGILLAPLPYPEPQRLVELQSIRRGIPDASSLADIVDWRASATSFSAMAAMSGETVNLTSAGGEPERVIGLRVTSSFFTLLGAPMLLGRSLADGNDTPSAERAVVIKESLWRRRFGAERSVLGTVISLNGEPHTIVGVIADRIAYPSDYTIWYPLALTEQNSGDRARGSRGEQAIARLRPGVTIAAAQREMDAIASRIATEHPNDNTGIGIHVADLATTITGDLRRPLLVLLGAVAFVLLIACANVANLLLVRASRREGEMAVRTALGAGRGRLIRQLVTESVLLSVIGAAAGLVLARWGVHGLTALAPGALAAPLATVHIDGTVLAFTAAVAILTGVAFGLLPAIQLRPAELTLSLRQGGRGIRSGRAASRTRDAIIVAEVALAVLLLAGAGLLLRSFQQLLRVEPGFRPEHVVTFNIALPDARYPEQVDARRFADALQERMRRLPGAEAIGLVSFAPMVAPSGVMAIAMSIEGRLAPRPGEGFAAEIRIASPDYFRTVGIPLVQGRSFATADREGSARVAIVNQEFVRTFFPDGRALGQRIKLEWSRDGVMQGGEIVGVVGDVKEFGPAEPARPFLFMPYEQVPYDRISVVVRSRAPASTVIAAAKAQVRAMDPDLPTYNARTFEQAIARMTARPRFYAVLLALFAGVALVLAGIGLYGVISYVVGQRTHEIGLRIALGAQRSRVQRMVVGRGLGLAGAGVALGLIAAAALTRVMASLLFGVAPIDPITFGSVAVLILGVAAVAAFAPARRAARVDPLVAMRAD
jgi:putative ABC transport system permease protein